MKNPASVGQATNLAAADARKNNKERDLKYIMEAYVFWTYVCEMFQAGDLDMIEEVLKKPELVEQLNKLKEMFQDGSQK